MKKENKNLETLRHSTSHVLAQAVIQMFPEAKLAIGPAIENGFYYDFDLPRTLIPEDLEILEKKMSDIIKSNLEIKPEKLTKAKALAFVKKIQQPYKAELIKDLEDKEVSFFRQGDFIDLCKGPHLDSTGEIPVFKLLKTSGAYWKGDEKNKMLQRIYGTAFYSQKELDEYLKFLEEAKKRDHRKLGQELDLFTFSDLVGAGLPLFTPKGTTLRNQLQKALFEISEPYGINPVTIPHMAKRKLYEISGHAEKFGHELFEVKSHYKEKFVLKPVNCPHHVQIYASRLRSYRDLPIRYMESTMMYRDEKPGEIGGLTRVRSITCDDGHTFCTPEQIKQEAKNICKIIKEFYSRLGMYGKHWVSLSVRDYSHPEKYIGDKKDWDRAEKMLKEISDEMKLGAKKIEGEAAIYGPKIDFMFKDSLGNERQLATVQIDFAMPKRFGIEYTDKDSKKKTPVMIHRAILGSYERFLAILIEHFAGAFPLWLSPVQVVILPISDKKHLSYAKDIAKVLKESKIRVEIDDRAESIGKRIRESEIQKIPYMLIVGDKEKQAGNISVRSYAEGDLGSQKLKDFIEKILIEIEKKK